MQSQKSCVQRRAKLIQKVIILELKDKAGTVFCFSNEQNHQCVRSTLFSARAHFRCTRTIKREIF